MIHLYRALSALFPTRAMEAIPQRIALIHPCCIGDVVLATAALKALRRGFPDAHITWGVGGWSRQAVADHPLLDAVLDTGPAANPAQGPAAMWRFARLLRNGSFDLVVSLVRSPWMSLAVAHSGIPNRAGPDSLGRGFGYTIRTRVNPQSARHEAQIYLDVVRTLGIDTSGCYANVPVHDADRQSMRGLLKEIGVTGDYVVVNPAGGSNPGMVMDAKRWPPQHFAALANALANQLGVRLVLIGGPQDGPLVESVKVRINAASAAFAGTLTFGQIAALAHDSHVYIGNDTGLTHLAAAAGARTVMIFGPSDPVRYAPFVPEALALWKPVTLRGGADTGAPVDWDWLRDGITPEDAIPRVLDFLRR